MLVDDGLGVMNLRTCAWVLVTVCVKQEYEDGRNKDAESAMGS